MLETSARSVTRRACASFDHIKQTQTVLYSTSDACRRRERGAAPLPVQQCAGVRRAGGVEEAEGNRTGGRRVAVRAGGAAGTLQDVVRVREGPAGLPAAS